MSVQTLPSPITFRGRAAARRMPGGRKFLIAAALFVVVLIAEALVIAAVAPSLPDVGTLYVTTT